MPSHTPKQARVMSAIAHGWRPSGLDIPVGVAKEFHEADKGHKWGAKGRADGGSTQPQKTKKLGPSFYTTSDPQNQPISSPSGTPIVPSMLGRAMGGVAPGLMSRAMNPTMPSQPIPGAIGVAPTQAVTGQMAPSTPLSGAYSRGGAPTGGSGAEKMTTGPLISQVPGRTDLHYTHVPSGSYVIPADIVSGHGQGNTLAGMKELHKLFRMEEPGHGSPVYDPEKMRSRGGSADKHVGKPVPVKLAGGEIVVPPHNLHETMERLTRKKLSLDQAHAEADKWIVKKRKKLRRTLAKLPGPAKD